MSLQDIILSSLANLQTDDGDLRGTLNCLLNTSWIPFINVVESKDMLIVHVELPGIHNDMKVNFFNNKLTISGNKQKLSTLKTVVKNEIGFGKYSRTITLPIFMINKKNVITEYENCILSIKINKKNEESNEFDIKINLL